MSQMLLLACTLGPRPDVGDDVVGAPDTSEVSDSGTGSEAELPWCDGLDLTSTCDGDEVALGVELSTDIAAVAARFDANVALLRGLAFVSPS